MKIITCIFFGILLLTSCTVFNSKTDYLIFNDYYKNKTNKPKNRFDYISQKLQDTSQDFILVSIQNYSSLVEYSSYRGHGEIQYLFLPFDVDYNDSSVIYIEPKANAYDSSLKYTTFKIIRYSTNTQPKVICNGLDNGISSEIIFQLSEIFKNQNQENIKYKSEFIHETELYIKYKNKREFVELSEFQLKWALKYLPLLDYLKLAIFEHEFDEKIEK